MSNHWGFPLPPRFPSTQIDDHDLHDAQHSPSYPTLPFQIPEDSLLNDNRRRSYMFFGQTINLAAPPHPDQTRRTQRPLPFRSPSHHQDETQDASHTSHTFDPSRDHHPHHHSQPQLSPLINEQVPSGSHTKARSPSNLQQSVSSFQSCEPFSEERFSRLTQGLRDVGIADTRRNVYAFARMVYPEYNHRRDPQHSSSEAQPSLSTHQQNSSFQAPRSPSPITAHFIAAQQIDDFVKDYYTKLAMLGSRINSVIRSIEKYISKLDGPTARPLLRELEDSIEELETALASKPEGPPQSSSRFIRNKQNTRAVAYDLVYKEATYIAARAIDIASRLKVRIAVDSIDAILNLPIIALPTEIPHLHTTTTDEEAQLDSRRQATWSDVRGGRSLAEEYDALMEARAERMAAEGASQEENQEPHYVYRIFSDNVLVSDVPLDETQIASIKNKLKGKNKEPTTTSSQDTTPMSDEDRLKRTNWAIDHLSSRERTPEDPTKLFNQIRNNQLARHILKNNRIMSEAEYEEMRLKIAVFEQEQELTDYNRFYETKLIEAARKIVESGKLDENDKNMIWAQTVLAAAGLNIHAGEMGLEVCGEEWTPSEMDQDEDHPWDDEVFNEELVDDEQNPENEGDLESVVDFTEKLVNMISATSQIMQEQPTEEATPAMAESSANVEVDKKIEVTEAPIEIAVMEVHKNDTPSEQPPASCGDVPDNKSQYSWISLIASEKQPSPTCEDSTDDDSEESWGTITSKDEAKKVEA